VLIREALRTSLFAIKLSVAYDGEEALSYLRAEWFDLVILDLNLPKVDGHTILRKRDSEASPSIVVFSSSDSPDDREQALTAGAMEYVVKPSGLDEFVHAVQHMLETASHISELRPRPNHFDGERGSPRQQAVNRTE
jgi:DNA-binding response OmpR family regulator